MTNNTQQLFNLQKTPQDGQPTPTARSFSPTWHFISRPHLYLQNTEPRAARSAHLQANRSDVSSPLRNPLTIKLPT